MGDCRCKKVSVVRVGERNMINSSSKKKGDPFLKYKKVVFSEFDFLIKDYGFQHVSTSVFPPECQIIYRNEVVEITVFYEWGNVPEILISKLKPTSSGLKGVDQKSLDHFIISSIPKERFDWNKLKGSIDHKVEAKLHRDAWVLRRYANKILCGK